LSDERLKIAVFVDFDNIEIGIKKTLSKHFDIGIVLEAVKERGEVVTKIAYGDWKHAADYSRAMAQHAVQMVQRDLTPGGDKNGADINLALDALEMAFTKGHINAFVIVGGDSDFIALVEKLKQYDKTVFVVGGRSFTSSILQKNCHEFIAYENLIGIQPPARKVAGRAHAGTTAQLRDALPLLRRALEILADREVSPQLGLLKSTLLQLDSTFSERDYGAHSFREFIQKMTNVGFVNLKHVDRSLIVEIKEGERGLTPRTLASPTAAPPHEAEPETAPLASTEPTPSPAQTAEAVEAMRQFLKHMGPKPHWPMYLRSFKHFLRSADPSFDERRYGFSSIRDLARQAQREGLLRIVRNRQGVLRLYPGDKFPQAPSEAPPVEEVAPAETVPASEALEPVAVDAPSASEPQADASAEALQESPAEVPAQELPPVPADAKPKRRRTTGGSPSTQRRRAAPKRPRVTRGNPEAL
jgi:uncharacterized LabA/DUF88 family protein